MAAITDEQRVVGWRGLLAPLPDSLDGPACGEASRAFHQLLGGVLHEFNETPPEEHEAVLARGLAEIGRVLGADRCYHYHTSGDGESLISLRQWYAPGVSPMSGDERLPPLARYPWSLARLRDEGALVIGDVQNLDTSAVPEQGRWLRQGITSLLVVPLRREREIVGVLGCETLGRVRLWGPRDRQLLEAMAEICQRVEGDDQVAQRLAQADERAGDLAELLPEPVAVTDTDDKVVVWNPALARLSALDAGAVRGRPGSEVVESFLPGCGAWLSRQLLRSPTFGERSPASHVVEVERPDGDMVWIQVSRRPLAEGAGSLLRFVELRHASDLLAGMRRYDGPIEASATSRFSAADR
jgi:PAS domain S-box-containing protein